MQSLAFPSFQPSAICAPTGLLGLLGVCLPYLIRFIQCLIVFRTTGNKAQVCVSFSHVAYGASRCMTATLSKWPALLYPPPDKHIPNHCRTPALLLPCPYLIRSSTPSSTPLWLPRSSKPLPCPSFHLPLNLFSAAPYPAAQIFNAVKYSSSFPALILTAFEHEAHMEQRPFALKGTWLLVMVVNTCYSFYWDLEQDWDMPWLWASVRGLRPTAGACDAGRHLEQ